MRDAQPVEMVCFDLGGVLVRIARTWREAMLAAGLLPPPGEFESALTDCPAFDAYQAALIGSEEYLAELGRYLGGLSAEEARQVHVHILVEPYPGTIELVRDLRRAGY